jgi:hypothetical protein
LSFKASQLHLRKANTTLLKKILLTPSTTDTSLLQLVKEECHGGLLIKHERRHEICLLFCPCRGHPLSVVLSFLLIVVFGIEDFGAENT